MRGLRGDLAVWSPMARLRGLSVAVLLMAVALTGCIGGLDGETGDDTDDTQAPDAPTGDTYDYEAEMVPGGDRTDEAEIEAPTGHAETRIDAAGVGEASVTVTDADGQPVIERTISGSTVCNSCYNSGDGAPGTWTVEVDVSQWGGEFSVHVEAS